jgi:hypothetical protein
MAAIEQWNDIEIKVQSLLREFDDYILEVKAILLSRRGIGMYVRFPPYTLLHSAGQLQADIGFVLLLMHISGLMRHIRRLPRTEVGLSLVLELESAGVDDIVQSPSRLDNHSNVEAVSDASRFIRG